MNPQELPALIGSKEARRIVGIRDKRTWRKFVTANPQIRCVLPGLDRPKFRSAELQKLLHSRPT